MVRDTLSRHKHSSIDTQLKIKTLFHPTFLPLPTSIFHVVRVCASRTCTTGVHTCSCYLTSCNAGVKRQRNLDTMQLMAGVLNSLKCTWAIGGDWNCTPAELQQTGWLKLVQGATVAPKAHTCGQRVLDFFVISDGLRQAAPAVYTIGDGGSTRIDP